jgi:assimilatory nitrate reductase catalytic subunit
MLAIRLGVVKGDPVRVVSRRGAARAEVRISDGIRLDTVFMPFHWPGINRANLITNPVLDPVSRMPEFKVCAVRIEPLPVAVSVAAQPPGRDWQLDRGAA